MKKEIILFVVTVLIMASAIIAFSAEVKTIRGEVIDISCYTAAQAKGEEHKECALACIKAGEPAGILEENTGNVYIVVSEDHMTNPATKVLPFVAKMVEVTGTVNEKGGVRTVDIKDIKEIPATEGTAKEATGMPKENKAIEGY